MLTRRTELRKLFWRPGELAGVRVGDVFLYAMAWAQEETGVAVNQVVMMPNHHHTHVEQTPEGGQLGDFQRRLHRESSIALKKLLAAEGYEAPPSVWCGSSKTHQLHLVGAAAEAATLTYARLNPVAAGLVGRLEDYPGVIVTWEDWKRGYIEVPRPWCFDGRKHPPVRRLWLRAPRQLLALFEGDLGALVYWLEKLARGEERAVRAAMKGAPMGAERLMALHPWTEPTAPRKDRELQGRVVPTFKVVGDDEEAERIRAHCADEVTAYRGDHRKAEKKWADPKVDRKTVVYPFGNHLRRLRDHVRVAPPKDDAILLRPAVAPPESDPGDPGGPAPAERSAEQVTAASAGSSSGGHVDFLALGAELDAALPDDPVEKKKALRALVEHEAAEQREALAEDDDHETLAERIQATDDPADLRAQTTRRTERVTPDEPAPKKVVHLRQHARRDRLDRERARQQAEAETDADSSEAATPRPAEPPRHKPES
ncbi:MAG TPA: hypothetical protein RMH85_31080 [Polyangiaceae bacterium LLY-WYZ-15_(1-7)]|nr:hypothetical protein [Polyangiaceae bacterium LLY-WYZ-15_(1-7)]HJL48134.1 hypothetical protein [Polyangiaceae bacterium LLY-WYZ-15_(1-7)]